MKLESLIEDKYYHIYNRGINGCVIFTNNANKQYFLNLFKKYLSTYVSPFAYCLLSNHFHLVIRIEAEPKLVTQAFSNLFNAYAKTFNKREERTGSLFEKHFKRIELTQEKHLQSLILYVPLNPKMHFGEDFENYIFSSYSSLISKKETLLKREEVLNLFENRENFIITHRNKNVEIEEKFRLE
ncbi:transposase [Zunongwangia sp. H14]|uniref:transposase n=1 Tax=Zunongwangia sp. H14 TaxID=3240792 RepID=UPI003562FBD2